MIQLNPPPPGGEDSEGPEAWSGAPIERRAYAAPYESLTFSMTTRASRELTVTLAAQPVFDLGKSEAVSRRVRRIIRHRGGEPALFALGRRTLDAVDLKRIDLQTLKHGLDLLSHGAEDSGVLPVFWRTVASSDGRFALLCAELQLGPPHGGLLVEVVGGLEQTPPEAITEAISHFTTRSMGVILHIASDAAAAARFTGVPAHCLALDFAGVEHEGARDWDTARRLIAAARQACPQVLLLNLRPDRGLAAHAAGATQAVFAGMAAVTV